MDNIIEITIDDECTHQPTKLLTPLKEHQLRVVNKAIDLEQNNIIDGNLTITTKCGIICDRVGTGKSFMMLGIIANAKTVPKVNTVIHSTNCDLITVTEELNINYDLDKKANIIVVPHNLFDQWKMYISQFTTFRTKYISKIKDMTEYNYYDMNIILVSSTIYTKFILDINNNNYCFTRLIFDEADSINITSCTKINANFYWFISSSINNLMYPIGKYDGYKQVKYEYGGESYNYLEKNKISPGICKSVFIKNTFKELHNLLYNKYLYIKCDDNLIDYSINIIQPIESIILCKKTQIFNVLHNIVDTNIQLMINAGNITGAIKELSIEETSETNLIKLVSNNLEIDLENKKIELEMKSRQIYRIETQQTEILDKLRSEITKIEIKINNIKERIQTNNIDPITYEDIENPVIVKCCNQKFDFMSISKWISSKTKPTCPMCRTIISTSSLISINTNGHEESKEESKEDSDSFEFRSDEHDKVDNLKYLLNNLITEGNKKILIFSEFTETFKGVKEMCLEQDLKFSQIKGHHTSIRNIIDNYKNSDLNILYLNARHCGAGLNLENTTDVIMCHRMNSDLEHQVIGRSQRIGRTCQLHIWKLHYDIE
jgi:hypothetical protein